MQCQQYITSHHHHFDFGVIIREETQTTTYILGQFARMYFAGDDGSDQGRYTSFVDELYAKDIGLGHESKGFDSTFKSDGFGLLGDEDEYLGQWFFGQYLH